MIESLDLGGTWKLRRVGDTDTIDAPVPGCVHSALRASKRVPDPYWRDNEKDLQWIGESGWEYERAFDVPESMRLKPHVELHCDGLDTIATVFLNGFLVGRANNQFRTWHFDVRRALRPGRNTIRVVFDSPVMWARDHLQTIGRAMPNWGAGSDKIAGGNLVRKSACNWGWDWGPMLVTMGIWRGMRLVGWDDSRLADVHVMQDHSRIDMVVLTVDATIEGLPHPPLIARVLAGIDGTVVASEEVGFSGATARAVLKIREPRLWWPSGMGAQPLYTVSIELKTLADKVIDRRVLRVGLRHIRLERLPDARGETFHFTCNGVPFFAKGANWIPADTHPAPLDRSTHEPLLRAAADAHMNMLRVWGGGIYESDAFYDLCDELGLCVWQDFMFACATYPTFDPYWMANVEAEARDNVRRIRHHACLALWCGNNELEQGLVGDAWNDTHMHWDDYTPLFDELLARVAHENDPQTDYWPASPHTPAPGDRRDFNDPNRGDAHLWTVWHGRQPFEWYRTCTHRFCSEFGFQSFPEPATVRRYTDPDDRNITSRIMEHHQRGGLAANSLIVHYMLSWFRLPAGFENTLWLSQILQGMAIKHAVEHWRRRMPETMGTLYWQLNDCWPVASWSSIDWFGRWKALHYMARRFYAPVLVSAVEDTETGMIDVHVTSDLDHEFDGTLRWSLTTAGGDPIASGEIDVSLPARASHVVARVSAREALDKFGATNVLGWLDLVEHGRTVSENLVLFARPKHLELEPPELTTQVVREGTATRVTITARRAALWVWLSHESGACRFANNFFHMHAGESRTIDVDPGDLKKADLTRGLRVQSLDDTWREE